MPECYHCGLPVPRGADYPVVVDGAPRAMCCPGCQAVASAIVDGGLAQFYRYRSEKSLTPGEDNPDGSARHSLTHYDLPEVQEDFVRRREDGTLAVELTIGGITCSACAWLIEHHLSRLVGVTSVSVNVTSRRGLVQWQPGKVALSDILSAFDTIGYDARPAGDVDDERQRSRESRTFLLRLGVAGLGMMQAGMVAVALYAGGFYGIEPQWQQLLRWVSLAIVTPVVLFSAQPFFRAALRSLRVGHLVMDVPVALAIALAYGASIWATVSNTGEVYFDSISMFTFFLLLGRYLEMRVRHRNEQYAGSLTRLVPPVAVRLDDNREQVVPVKALHRGDRVRVACGETIPCDGEVLAGDSDVVEAVLTGEERPVAKVPGAAVSAGTVNLGNPLEIRVAAIGQHTRLAAILDLVAAAQAVKPRRAALADRLSGWFVAAVLVTAAAVGGSWLAVDPSRALWITLSVLVVTCPCALSLATPAALTVATGELKKLGFLIRKPHVLEALAALDHCILDKTGTLTRGQMRIADVQSLGTTSAQALLTLAAALERGASHPIARAFRHVETGGETVQHQQVITGCGVKGTVAGEALALGTPNWVCAQFDHACPAHDGDGLTLLLASQRQCLGFIRLSDEVRPGAVEAVARLQQQGLGVELLSGDRRPAVARLAAAVGIAHWRGEARPEDKLTRIRQLQDAGRAVMMVGDGINDVPVLSGATVSVAMGDAADLTRLHADSLLVSGNLSVLARAVALARRTVAIIRQNLAWALLYNLLALPLAALGYIPPWAAAIGMSCSSLLVVLNALRLTRSNGEASTSAGGDPELAYREA